MLSFNNQCVYLYKVDLWTQYAVHPGLMDLPKRIEHSSTCGPATQHRLVLDRRKIWTFLQRSKQWGHRDNHTRGFQTAGRPDVPTETDSIAVLVLLDELLEGRHSTLWKRQVMKGLSCVMVYLDKTWNNYYRDRTAQCESRNQALCPLDNEQTISYVDHINKKIKLRDARQMLPYSQCCLL